HASLLALRSLAHVSVRDGGGRRPQCSKIRAAGPASHPAIGPFAHLHHDYWIDPGYTIAAQCSGGSTIATSAAGSAVPMPPTAPEITASAASDGLAGTQNTACSSSLPWDAPLTTT